MKAVGVKSNRTGIGARVASDGEDRPRGSKPLVQMDEVRSGGSYYSQNDLRLHFGLDKAETVDSIEIRWPSGQVDTFRNLQINRLYVVSEGAKTPQAITLR